LEEEKMRNYKGNYVGYGSRRRFDGKLFRYKAYIPYGDKKKLDAFMEQLRLNGYFVRKTKWRMKGQGSGYNIWVRRK
jgi:hypothetical protein